MTTIPLGEATDSLSALVESAETTQDIITITRDGRPAAALISADYLESLHETLAWLSHEGVARAVAEAERESQSDETTSGKDLRAEFGLPAQ